MKLVSVYTEPGAAGILYQLLAERPVEARISHEKMPSRKTHAAFVRSRPYRYWFLIEGAAIGGGPVYVGDLCVTHLNEIGISILNRYKSLGWGEAALQLLMKKYRPLRPIPAVRSALWLANIAEANFHGRSLFHNAGFRVVQVTYGRK